VRHERLSTVILAGGQGRRMGGLDKALLAVGQETIFQRQLREAAALSGDVVVVANAPELAKRLLAIAPDVRIVADAYAGEGPLAGVHAGFRAADCPCVWLLGCDQPFASAAVASYLLDRLDESRSEASVPLIGGKLQPLHAVYRKETGGIAEELLLEGERRMRQWLDRLDYLTVEEDELRTAGQSASFAEDIDTPEQYAMITSRWTKLP